MFSADRSGRQVAFLHGKVTKTRAAAMGGIKCWSSHSRIHSRIDVAEEILQPDQGSRRSVRRREIILLVFHFWSEVEPL